MAPPPFDEYFYSHVDSKILCVSPNILMMERKSERVLSFQDTEVQANLVLSKHTSEVINSCKWMSYYILDTSMIKAKMSLHYWSVVTAWQNRPKRLSQETFHPSTAKRINLSSDSIRLRFCYQSWTREHDNSRNYAKAFLNMLIKVFRIVSCMCQTASHVFCSLLGVNIWLLLGDYDTQIDTQLQRMGARSFRPTSLRPRLLVRCLFVRWIFCPTTFRPILKVCFRKEALL